MLHSVRKHRRAVAQSMIAAIVLTWLSLVCQQCLAHAPDAQTVLGDSALGAHCMGPAADDPVPVTGQSSCASDCDCSAMVAASTVSPPTSFLPAPASDPMAAPPAPITHAAVAACGTHVTLPGLPHGVTPPLLERFCIHLE